MPRRSGDDRPGPPGCSRQRVSSHCSAGCSSSSHSARETSSGPAAAARTTGGDARRRSRSSRSRRPGSRSSSAASERTTRRATSPRTAAMRTSPRTASRRPRGRASTTGRRSTSRASGSCVDAGKPVKATRVVVTTDTPGYAAQVQVGSSATGPVHGRLGIEDDRGPHRLRPEAAARSLPRALDHVDAGRRRRLP